MITNPHPIPQGGAGMILTHTPIYTYVHPREKSPSATPSRNPGGSAPTKRSWLGRGSLPPISGARFKSRALVNCRFSKKRWEWRFKQ